MFKKDAVPLKNNYFLANIRYRSLMKSFHKYPERLKAYNEAMLKMLENEEIELVNETAKDSKILLETCIICHIPQWSKRKD